MVPDVGLLRARALLIALLFVPLGFTIQATGSSHGLVDGNDDFADAFELTPATLPHTASVDTTSATWEAGEPTECSAGSHSIWYKYTPADDIGLQTMFNGFSWDIVIFGLFSGTALDNLQLIECDRRSTLTYAETILRAGTTYYIQFADYATGSGGEFDIAFEAADLESHDDFANAKPVTGDFQDVVDSRFLTFEEGEPTDCGFDRHSVWYRYESTTTGTLVLSTAGTFVSTMLAAYTGDAFTNLAQVACDDQPSGSGSPYIDFHMEAGTTYFLKVATGGPDRRLLTITAEVVLPVANDDFVNAIAITTPSAAVLRVEDATTEPNETTDCMWYETVWYTITPPASGTLVVRFDASSYAASAGLFTGNSVDDLNEIACAGGYNHVDMRAHVEAGTTYHIQLGGGSSRLALLDVTFDWYETPSNDAFADALELVGNPVSADANTIGATREAGEGYACGDLPAASRWYSYTATSDDTLRISLMGSQTPTEVSVYTGTQLSDLVDVAESCFAGDGHVQFAAVPGTRYWIQVDADNGLRGPATLSVSQHTRPAHDEQATPLDITVPFAQTVDTRGATTDSEEPLSCTRVQSTLWYRFEVTQRSWFLFGGSASDFRPITTLFSDEADPSYLGCSGQWYDEDLHDSDALLNPGSYLLRVGENNGLSGDAYVTIDPVAGPANDHRADATLLTEGVAVASALSFATYEDGENLDPCDTGSNYPPTNTVWHMFVPSRDALVEVTSSRFSNPALYYEDGGELVVQDCSIDRSPVQAGQTYWIQTAANVGTHARDYNFTMQYDLIEPGPGDMFAGALDLSIPGSHTLVVDYEATRELGEPADCTTGGTQWYRVTLADPAWVRFDMPNTFGYNVGLYKGDTLDALEHLHCFPSASAGASLEDTLAGGSTYYLQVRKWASTVDDLVLNMDILARPANDLIRHATQLGDLPALISQATTGARSEGSEPRPCVRDGTRTVWFRYVAQDAGTLSLDTTASGFDTQMAVYAAGVDQGPLVATARSFAMLGWNDLQKVGCADLPNGGETLDVPVVAGRAYYVQVAGNGARSGQLELDVSFQPL